MTVNIDFYRCHLLHLLRCFFDYYLLFFLFDFHDEKNHWKCNLVNPSHIDREYVSTFLSLRMYYIGTNYYLFSHSKKYS